MTIHQDFSLSNILWYKIGGKAKYFLECSNRVDVLHAIDFINIKKLKKIFICGLGSNVLFSDDYFDGAVIRIVSEKNISPFIKKDGLVEVFAGEILGDLVKFCLDNSLLGLEWAGGLPGTVGAGVRGNVGAFGGEIKDTLFTADIIDYSSNDFSTKTVTRDDLQFVYRGSLIKTQKKNIVLSSSFQLRKGSSEEVLHAREVYERNIQFRKDHHPLEYPNCGSVFKNIRKKEEIEKILSVFPEFKEDVETKWHGKIAMASLIEKIGFKGYRIGDAQISQKHALFIVNLGQAKAKDVLQIIQDLQDKFQVTFGFVPEVEVEIVK